MRMITKTFRQHINLIQKNFIASAFILIIFSIVMYDSYLDHAWQHGIGYLFAVWFSIFITDLIVNIAPKRTIGFPIKKPISKEVSFILISTLLGTAFLIVRFASGWGTMNPFVKISLLPLMLFAFPIALAVGYLFVYKYKPKELGINFNYWYLPLFIHLIFGCITMWVAPEKSHWVSYGKELGILDLIFTGLISAGLSEEFLRMLMQTRLGKAFNNFGLGFVAATVIWALMHVPNFFSQSNEAGALKGAFLGAVNIMPIGLLWGYITHRTKSLIPSVFIHGFNLWGLQNF